MEKLRVSVVLESEADSVLFTYLVKMPPRRRATLIRTLATKGMMGEVYDASGLRKEEMEVSLSVQNRGYLNKEVNGVKRTVSETSPAEAEKERALGNALSNSSF
jgi:hypothetical protein